MIKCLTCTLKECERKEGEYGQDYHPHTDQIFMILSLIHASLVLDSRIRMVMFSKGLSLEIRNLKANDVIVPVKKCPKPTDPYVSVLPPHVQSQTYTK